MSNREIIDAKALEAGGALGQEVFGINMQPEIDAETSIGHPAMYDWTTDRVRVFANGVKMAVEAGGDAFHVVRHAVAHELGHAREARYFAEHGVFPWKFNIDPRCVLVAEGTQLLATRFSSFFEGLINSIQDFAIDKRLSQYNIKDQIARLDLERTKDIQTSLRASSNSLERIRLRLQTVFNLPLDISHYTFGDISDDDRKRIREVAETFLGMKKWRESLELISSRNFGDIYGYKQMIASYLRDFIGVASTFRKRPGLELGLLPNFWSADLYEVLFVK